MPSDHSKYSKYSQEDSEPEVEYELDSEESETEDMVTEQEEKAPIIWEMMGEINPDLTHKEFYRILKNKIIKFLSRQDKTDSLIDQIKDDADALDEDSLCVKKSSTIECAMHKIKPVIMDHIRQFLDGEESEQEESEQEEEEQEEDEEEPEYNVVDKRSKRF